MSVLSYGCNITKDLEEKARLELHKNVFCCFEQTLEAAP